MLDCIILLGVFEHEILLRSQKKNSKTVVKLKQVLYLRVNFQVQHYTNLLYILCV